MVFGVRTGNIVHINPSLSVYATSTTSIVRNQSCQYLNVGIVLTLTLLERITEQYIQRKIESDKAIQRGLDL